MATTIRDIRTGKGTTYSEVVARRIRGRDVVRGALPKWGRVVKWVTLLACNDRDEAARIAEQLNNGGNWKQNGDIFTDDDPLPRKHKPDSIL